jgi:Winged helix-turn helix
VGVYRHERQVPVIHETFLLCEKAWPCPVALMRACRRRQSRSPRSGPARRHRIGDGRTGTDRMPHSRGSCGGLFEGVPGHEVGCRGDAGHERPASPLAARGRPRMAGWRTSGGRWTRSAMVIARRFHIRFSPAQIWRILRQMGWSVQVPQRRAAERDEGAVVTWIRETWPRLERR